MPKYPELENCKTLLIPLRVIYFDNEFNCRGRFTPHSCFELSESIEAHGLLEPIIVQPREDVPTLDERFEFRIVAGHRRYTAVKYLLQWKAIPATVKTGLTEDAAKVLNLIENLERKNLTFYQEAVALRKNYAEGTSFEKMARDLSKSSSWCRFRWKLLDMPDEVVELVENGTLKQAELTLLFYKSKEDQLAMASEMAMARLHGDKKRTRKFTARLRARTRREIDEMLSGLMTVGRYPDPYEALRWAAGRLTDDELWNPD